MSSPFPKASSPAPVPGRYDSEPTPPDEAARDDVKRPFASFAQGDASRVNELEAENERLRARLGLIRDFVALIAQEGK